MGNKYLVRALRAFRTETYGQFDQVTYHVVQETQDAADEIDRLNAVIDQLKLGLLISFDGKDTRYGLTGAIAWDKVARLVQDTKEPGMVLVSLMPKPDGLYYIAEHAKRES